MDKLEKVSNSLILNISKKVAVAFIIIAILGLSLMVYRVFSWVYPEYAYVDIVLPYAGVNIVAGWADFLFVTYIAFTLFCLWLLFAGIGALTQNSKICKTVFNPYVFLFIVILQTVVPIVYTCFEIINVFSWWGGEFAAFGWYGNYPGSWRGVIESLIIHYGVSTFAIVLWQKSKVTQKLNLKKCYLFYILLLLYFVVVLLCGKFAFDIEWYPYISFSHIAMWKQFFGVAEIIEWLAYILMIVANLCILAVFLVINILYIKTKNKKFELDNKKSL